MPTLPQRLFTAVVGALVTATALAGPLVGEPTADLTEGHAGTDTPASLTAEVNEHIVDPAPVTLPPALWLAANEPVAPIAPPSARAPVSQPWSPFNGVVNRRDDRRTQPGAYALLGGALLLAGVAAHRLTWSRRGRARRP